MAAKSPEIKVIDPKPFLRWAGGKAWLIKYLREPLQEISFNNYYECFLGGASVFLAIEPGKKSYLSDTNPELINAYEVVRDHVERLISELKKYKNTESFYYSVRESTSTSKIKRAAKFVFLNQTSFNGIYRVNLNGVYNVPYGFRTKDFIGDDNLRLVSQRLKGVSLRCLDFTSNLKKIKKRDLVFLDPPYTVSHNHNGFIKYNQKLFSIDDQYRLAEFVKAVKKKGAYYILTNAAHKTTNKIFGQIDSRIELSRASLIGGLDAKRGHVSEYLFTNIPTFDRL